MYTLAEVYTHKPHKRQMTRRCRNKKLSIFALRNKGESVNLTEIGFLQYWQSYCQDKLLASANSKYRSRPARVPD